ncbi:unnamed protein product [Didymodactylos carnosus]|uniref:Beta-lactamase-related domain-containing protein n=4 Tax=Didymodactylos carnosus TaxID=1234261 RepID=A0A8S2GPZ1_9BILA|nr:unnamed protein product [Didymodactylos carnosus]CAF3543714.1 unnamed protein product [Didymodactylos carnosus]
MSEFNVEGLVEPNWEIIRDLFEQNFRDGSELGASLCIYHQGKCVIDLSGGWTDQEHTKPYTRDTLQLVFSTTKGIVAAAVALCVQRGWLDYNELVTKYWPEFGQNGKETITVSDLLSHRAGLPTVDQCVLDDVLNWKSMTDLLAKQKPFWEPGTAHGYHAVTFGWLAGELIRRVDPKKRSVGEFVLNEIAKPMNSEFYIGLPEDKDHRVSPLERKIQIGNMPPFTALAERALTLNGTLSAMDPSKPNTFNSVSIHRAELPAANGITNARSLARIYASFIGDVDGHARLLNENTLQQATRCATPEGEPDRILFGIPSTFGMGFMIHGVLAPIFGQGIFGHGGVGGSVAFAYPAKQLAIGYVLNELNMGFVAVDPRVQIIIDAINPILDKMEDTCSKSSSTQSDL